MSWKPERVAPTRDWGSLGHIDRWSDGAVKTARPAYFSTEAAPLCFPQGVFLR